MNTHLVSGYSPFGWAAVLRIMRMIAWRLCTEHGVLDGGALTCPHCGVATLDGTDPSQSELVTAAFFARPQNMRRIGIAWGVIVLMVIFGVYIWSKHERVGSLVGHGLAIAGIAVLVWASRQPREWRIPVESRLRRWTSAPTISVMLCLLFVVIREAVGVQALWYGAGLPVWRIATATLTHGGFMHLLGNMAFAWLFGTPVDLRVGRAWTAVIIAASAIAAALAQAHYSAEPMVGFSGAVYGLLGATLALMPTSPQVLRMSAAAIVVPTWAWMIVIIPAYTLVAAFDSHSHVAWVAHLGGFLAGLIVALPMRRVTPSEEFLLLEKRRRDRALSRAAAYETATLTSELAPEASDTSNVVTNQDAEIEAFHAAARRRRVVVSTIGGIAMLGFGGAATLLATIMKAAPLAGGRRANVIIVGLVMCLAGAFMLLQAAKEARVHKRRP